MVHFKAAEELSEGQHFEEAIEEYMNVVFDEKLRGARSPVSIKSRERILKLTADL